MNYVVGSSVNTSISCGVIQEPEVAYNISGGGANIVFTAACSGDTVFVVFLGVAQDIGTLGTGAITSQTSLGEALKVMMYYFYMIHQQHHLKK